MSVIRAKMNVAIDLDKIDIDQINQVYRGRQGCMCGCRGTYKDTPTAKKRFLTDLKKHLADGVELDAQYGSGEDKYILFMDYGQDRTMVLYTSQTDFIF